MSSPTTAQAEPAKPRFTDGDRVSTNEGHATIHWELPGGVEGAAPEATFELQQSADPSFSDGHRRHRGPGRAFFVSGLKDGRTYFRVRTVSDGSATGPWSDALVVEVDYPDRGRVVLFLVIGSLVFLGTCAAIVSGWLRTHRRGDGARA